MNADELKRAAAAKALESVESGMALGLGTGSTVRHLVDLLGEALREGRLTDIVGVPTSVQTERQALEVGIPSNSAPAGNSISPSTVQTRSPPAWI